MQHRVAQQQAVLMRGQHGLHLVHRDRVLGAHVGKAAEILETPHVWLRQGGVHLQIGFHVARDLLNHGPAVAGGRVDRAVDRQPLIDRFGTARGVVLRVQLAVVRTSVDAELGSQLGIVVAYACDERVEVVRRNGGRRQTARRVEELVGLDRVVDAPLLLELLTLQLHVAKVLLLAREEERTDRAVDDVEFGGVDLPCVDAALRKDELLAHLQRSVVLEVAVVRMGIHVLREATVGLHAEHLGGVARTLRVHDIARQLRCARIVPQLRVVGTADVAPRVRCD